MGEKLYEVKTMVSNNIRHHFIKFKGEDNWKLHRWDGPAMESTFKGSNSENRWFLNGIEYTSDQYHQNMRDREGLPWFKKAGGDGRV
jgi:hypothetical protein